jgi:hypothetical protein
LLYYSVEEEIMPGRADYLAADAVLRNRSPVVQFPANREKNRDSSRKRPFPPETDLESAIRFNELRRNSLRFVTGK